MRKQTLIIALACTGWTVKAQDTLKTVHLDEVVVTGTKSEIPVEKSGKTIFKMTQEDIESSGGQTVADILNQVPGVQMDGNFGPLGTNISYYVRGASSKRTLILIDGVPFNDPSGINQTYDLRLLDLGQVESIEVLKGGLSSLYGSGAAAGVINITLKKAIRDGLSGSIGADYGSFNTLKTSLSVSGKQEKINYLINGGYKRSDGFSSAQDVNENGDFDEDGFQGYNFLGKLGYDLSKTLSLTFTGALDDFSYDYDAGEFTDANNTSDYRQLRFGISPTLLVGDAKIKGDVFFSKLNRFFDTPNGFTITSEYDANNFQADFLIDKNLKENLKLVGGVNFQNLSYSQPDVEETSFQMIDPYVSFIFDQSDFNLQLGARLNQHSEYGSNFVYNINPSYLIGMNPFDLKLISSYSTSFITPSLFQLFGPFGANPELKPEESESVEGGVSILGASFKMEMAYFFRKDDNLIVYGGGGYENAGANVKTDGIELNSEVTLSEKILLRANYTYVRRLEGAQLLRIPAHKYGMAVQLKPIKGVLLNASYQHTGDRDQPFFNPNTFETEIVETADFDLVDLFASYQINSFTLSASINNVFDEDYIAIYGFNSVGRNYMVGLTYHFN